MHGSRPFAGGGDSAIIIHMNTPIRDSHRGISTYGIAVTNTRALECGMGANSSNSRDVSRYYRADIVAHVNSPRDEMLDAASGFVGLQVVA